MSTGLDVGTQFCVSAHTRDDGQIDYATQRNVYLALPVDDVSRAMLELSGSPMAEHDGKLLVFGDAALETASIRHLEVERPLQQGTINAANVDSALPMLAAVLKYVMPFPSVPGEDLVYTIPSQPVDSPNPVSFHKSAIDSLFAGPLKADWRVCAVLEGTALALGTLQKHSYTGIACSFGAGMVNTSFVVRGVPVFDFSIARGGDWIDATAARSVGEEASYIIQVKESDDYSLAQSPTGGVALAIVSAYNAFLDYWAATFAGVFREYQKRIPRLTEVPMVVAGGTSLAPGFLEAVKTRVGDCPVKIGTVEHADDPLRAVARGAYILAAQREKRR